MLHLALKVFDMALLYCLEQGEPGARSRVDSEGAKLGRKRIVRHQDIIGRDPGTVELHRVGHELAEQVSTLQRPATAAEWNCSLAIERC